MNPFKYPAIILASQSPRRAELLTQMGVPFQVVVPDDVLVAECLEDVQFGELPKDYVLRVSHAKTDLMRAQIRQRMPANSDKPILCADTTVALGTHILGKPADEAQAYQTLKLLSNQTHQVHTAVCIQKGDKRLSQVVTSEVRFCYLNDTDIRRYIETGEPFGKAGAYAIQGYGGNFVAHLSGSFSAVKGLPIFEVGQMLQELMLFERHVSGQEPDLFAGNV